MLIIQRPTVEPLGESEENRQRFVISPLEPGFGHTLGNSLRRTLLSSIPGAAVTQLRFDDSLHEFATISGVKEDVTDIILNLKDLVLNVHSEEAGGCFEAHAFGLAGRGGQVESHDFRGSPASHPERLSGLGFEPLSSCRATFSPSSVNISLSSSGSEPSVVRKLPIITPFNPALTASGCSSPRFSTRPPQSRKSASGRISLKIAMNFTASHGSISSRSPNFVPGRGLSRLIGTLVGSISASSKAISTR